MEYIIIGGFPRLETKLSGFYGYRQLSSSLRSTPSTLSPMGNFLHILTVNLCQLFRQLSAEGKIMVAVRIMRIFWQFVIVKIVRKLRQLSHRRKF